MRVFICDVMLTVRNWDFPYRYASWRIRKLYYFTFFPPVDPRPETTTASPTGAQQSASNGGTRSKDERGYRKQKKMEKWV